MANELVINYPTGNTLYALLYDATGNVWNGSAFAAPGSANWLDYDIAMTEVATATGIYRASMPAAVAGVYGWTVRKQAGANPAVTDIAVGAGRIEWSGTAEVTLTSRATQTSVDDVPTVTEFELRTLPAADYTVVSDLGTVQTGDSYPVVSHTDYGNAKLVRATTPANTLDIEATGEVSANVTTWNGVAVVTPAIAGAPVVTVSGTLTTLDALWTKVQKWLRLGYRKDAAAATDHATELAEINANTGTGVGTFVSTTDSLQASRDNVDTRLDLVANGVIGTGSIPFVYTVTEPGGVIPISGVVVEVYTEQACVNCVRRGTTDTNGVVTFMMTTAGTYWIVCLKDGFEFDLDSEVVAA